jgi:hypothetical protein
VNVRFIQQVQHAKALGLVAKRAYTRIDSDMHLLTHVRELYVEDSQSYWKIRFVLTYVALQDPATGRCGGEHVPRKQAQNGGMEMHVSDVTMRDVWRVRHHNSDSAADLLRRK